MDTITHIETGGVSRAIEDTAARQAIGIPTEPQTLVAGQSAVTFTLDNLKENSGIRVEVADISTLSHRGIVIEGNKVTVKFEPQEEDVLVRLVISEALSSTVN